MMDRAHENKSSNVSYQLVESTTSAPWAGMGVSAIELTDSITNISQLRHAIYAANRRLVEAHVDELELRLYSRDVQLEAQTLLSECALQLKNVLTVAVVPDLFELLRRAHEATSSVEDPSAKRLKPHRTVIDDGVLQSARQNLNIESWKSTGVVPLQLHRIEPDFPKSFYIRQAIIDIIQVYRRQRDSDRQTMFVGSPGVGKSTLLMLFAFYRALYEKKRVVLFRRLGPYCYSMLYLDVVGKRCWRIDNAGLPDLDELRDHEFELFLDGFPSDFARFNYGRIEGFRFLAPSALIGVNSHEVHVKWCLVPYWNVADLSSFGEVCLRMTKSDIVKQFFYSGGSLDDFLSDEEDVKQRIFTAVHTIDGSVAVTLLDTNEGLFSPSQIDCLRMLRISSVSQAAERGLRRNTSTVDRYLDPRWWTGVITSRHAMDRLGERVPIDFYEQLWEVGSKIGDDSLKGIAFENYLHSSARNHVKLTLEVREYDRPRRTRAKRTRAKRARAKRGRVRQRHAAEASQEQPEVGPSDHKYVSIVFHPRSFRHDGRNEAECEAAMRTLAGPKGVDYWYPLDRCLTTIDSIAKLKLPASPSRKSRRKRASTTAASERIVNAMLQITKAAKHDIDSAKVDSYAGLLVTGETRYIAVVPDKLTCDSFRLKPVSPMTKIPLYVAYVKEWASRRSSARA